MYLGRSPAFARFVIEIADAARRRNHPDVAFIVASQTVLAEHLKATGANVVAIDTFRNKSAWQILCGYFRARKAILGHLAQSPPANVVTLMPHVWSPLLGSPIKRKGASYATIIHDSEPHPGDPTAWMTSWLKRDAENADVVFTLSQFVADHLGRTNRQANKPVSLFHPDLPGSSSLQARTLDRSRPLRILFFGRIMPYKGLELLISAVEILRRRGTITHIGVAGAGEIDHVRDRLAALDAEVENRWLDDATVDGMLSRYDAVACTHIEASQSGVASLALGNNMPVIATPVGGLQEQIVTGSTGVLATGVSAEAVAEAIATLSAQPVLYDRISRHIRDTRHERSAERFLDEVLARLGYESAPLRVTPSPGLFHSLAGHEPAWRSKGH